MGRTIRSIALVCAKSSNRVRMMRMWTTTKRKKMAIMCKKMLMRMLSRKLRLRTKHHTSQQLRVRQQPLMRPLKQRQRTKRAWLPQPRRCESAHKQPKSLSERRTTKMKEL